MHEVGGGLEQAHSWRLLLAEFNETGIGLDRAVLKVAGEVVERLLRTVSAGENNPYARRTSFAAVHEVARSIERHRRNRIDCAAGPRDEDIERRKRAAELRLR